MALQISPSTHQGNFSATPNSRLFLIYQWVPSIQIIIMVTLSMLRLLSNTAPLCAAPNIAASMRQADVKSGALKNTHVTFTKKKVNSAYIKLDDGSVFKNLGAAIPRKAIGALFITFGCSCTFSFKSCINFSAIK